MSPGPWLVVALATGLFGRCGAQTTWRNQINISMCTWEELRVSTIRDTVYLDGGHLWWQLGYSDGSVLPVNPDNYGGLLYYLNLSASFDTATTNLTALFGSIPKSGGIANNLAPTYHDGVMFANDDKFYLYGGLLLPTASQSPPDGNAILAYERYQYGPFLNLWQPGFINTDLDNDVTRYITSGAGVSSPSENLGFYVSGMRAPNWGPIYDNQSATTLSSQMIKVDMSQMRDSRWYNVSLPQFVPPRANAEAVWIPVSEQGILVLIGGVIYPEFIFTSSGLDSGQQNASERSSPAFMDTVSIYDIANDQWYLQNTTGDIPPQLTQFCSVYATASDGTSHNIYIYGGYDGLSPTHIPSDDVYVLSLPSFEWIKLYSGDSRTHGRKAHKCVKPYPDRMLVLGGSSIDPSSCIDMIQVFNLNTGRFQDTYNPAQWNTYQVPDLVSGRIGGDSTGGATKTAPNSWTNSSLAQVFAASYTKTIATWYPYNTTSHNSTPTPVPVPSGGSSGFPAWAGAIIGVLLGLLLIVAAAVFWFLRRRRSYQGSRQTSAVSGNQFRAMQGMYSGASATDAPKDHETTVSSTCTKDSAVEQSVATTHTTAEAGSEPLYEVHGTSSPPPVELPTPYNEISLPSPSLISSTCRSGYVSPIFVDIPEEETTDSQPPRPTHRRHVSSLSSARSLSIANRMYDDQDGRLSERSRYISGASEASISSSGSQIREESKNTSGLEDIQDTEKEK
ncbi:hypothetical protein P175DRAFT_0476114 [Aspergillus ochraceoroseus IBT 24754]|uniref:Kelch repeat protein n=1 Tax=Aspergillus ochraceoroseus IBT 24754 TaxID=1392256 RepID=A0A2T5M4X4_9EURO|nr:uncharacterized protein P175DRAFT_0476114 [Aspergillus ochraceoroseus IBT 24754]PTU23593.1 hypothetical protein P175DRAFT_0476114 [Aspergillus ochraceoroseus IBT 24754]